MYGAIAASIGKGLPKRTWRTDGKRRRPGGRKKLTTSQAAIRRFEARKRGGTDRTPPTRKPWRPEGGPRRDASPTGRGPRRTTRTSRTAITRAEGRRGGPPPRSNKRGKFNPRIHHRDGGYRGGRRPSRRLNTR